MCMYMEFEKSIALKLISEMKKPGRECLYDMGSKGYKNNHLRQIVWSAIANDIGINRSECQALWKKMRRRYKTAKIKNMGKSDSQGVKVKGFSKMLMKEMDFFQNFWEDDEPTVVTSCVDTKGFRNLYYEISQDPDVKQIKLNDVDTNFEESLKTLNTLASSVLQATDKKRDPFFLALEDEFVKVPDNKKSALKVKLMSLIVEHQSNF